MLTTGNDRSQHLVTAGACLFVAVLGVLRLGGILGVSGGPPEMPSGERPHADAAQKATGMSLVVPRIELEAPIVELGIGDDEQLEVPRRVDRAGWWAGGPRPGDAGPAVVVGHVDSAEGPAVFERIHELQPGDEVMVRQPEGEATRFVVTRSEQVQKSRYPTARVDGDAADAELRLVTARYDTDNLVVYAALSP